MPLRRRELGLSARLWTRPSTRRCAEPTAPLPAPVLAGARAVRHARLRVGGLSARGVITRSSHPASVAPLQQTLLVSAAFLGRSGHFGRLAPSGTRAGACGSEGLQGRRRELGRPWPLGVGELRGRGGGSRARSPQRLPQCSRLGPTRAVARQVPPSAAASVGRPARG